MQTENKKKQKKLTTRQWILYRYLKKNYAEGVYISKYQICQDIEQYKYNTKQTRMCRDIESDIRALNSSDEIHKIIVSNRVGYKIGNKQEVWEYLMKREDKQRNSYILTNKLWEKARLNKQMRETYGTQERDTIESFM